jgi:type II secretory pathway component GspD/PulD (secretin)
MSSKHRLLLHRFDRTIRALTHALLLAGSAGAAHGAVEIDAKFIQVRQKEGCNGRTPAPFGMHIPAAGEAGVMGILKEPDGRTALESIQKYKGADLLATPRLIVESGRSASISIGQEFQDAAPPKPRGREGGKQQEKNLKKHPGFTLAVTPTHARNGALQLRLAPEFVELTGFVWQGKNDKAVRQPVFETTRLNTVVSILSGETVVLAMPTHQSTETVEERVPVLGRIPLLGKLFTSRRQVKLDQRLYVLVTARAA